MDTGCRLLAAKYIRRQVKQLAAQLDGVRAADDIEYVHRARVAIRRLRAALKMFGDCFSRKRLRRWRKAIRRTADELGDARDCDVQIETLCGLLANLHAKECFPGIARILVQLERQREGVQRRVVQTVDRIERQRVLKEMRRTTKRMIRKAEQEANNGSTSEVCQKIGRHILEQLNKLMCHRGSLSHPEDRQQHHKMRIAAKRLRYSLEITRPIYRGRLEDAIEAIKQVQSRLGEVHDCDVWLDHLDAFVSDEQNHLVSLFGHPGRLTRFLPGVEYLRHDRSNLRRQSFEQLVAFWNELSQNRFWEKLAGIILEPSSKIFSMNSSSQANLNTDAESHLTAEA